MPAGWRPAAGQIALIERGDDEGQRVTGVVLGASGGPIVIHLGGSRPAVSPGEVVASFVGPDALYRMHATLSLHDGTEDTIDLIGHSVERVQRRSATRVALRAPVVLSNFDEPAPGASATFSSIQGESVDMGEGGCRVRVPEPFPPGCDPTVSLELPSGRMVVALAAISQVTELPDGRFEYRLVFLQIDRADQSAIRDVIAGLTGG